MPAAKTKPRTDTIMNLPSIEELRHIASAAGRKAPTGGMLTAEVTAVRDAVVAACRPQPVDPANIPDLVTHLDPRNCGLTIQLGVKAAAEINDKFRERMVEALAACRPQFRPIAEMPAEVPERCARISGFFDDGEWRLSNSLWPRDTHFIDIALPSPSYPVDFEQAFAESKLDAKDKDSAFKLWKGGAR